MALSRKAPRAATRIPAIEPHPGRFVLLVLALSIPFWIVGALAGVQLAPSLPVSALQAVCPLIAALLLTSRERGTTAAFTMLRRSVTFNLRRYWPWYLAALLLAPAISLVVYLLLRATGHELPPAGISLGVALPMILGFLVFAWAEEVGWSGYALDPLQAGWGTLQAAVLLGVAWGFWHLFPLLQAHRSADWILWWLIGTVASRVLLVWLYNSTGGGSVVAPALLHASQNTCWLLFPYHGSHFDPRFNSPVLLLVMTVLVATSRGSRWRRE